MKSETSPISGALCDYLAAIYILSGGSGNARITDISVYLNISKPSVNRAVNSLSNQGFVEHKPYGGITLTDKGAKAGAYICGNRGIVRDFLTEILGVAKDRAESEARYIERGISRETIEKMAKLIENKKA